MPASQNWSSAAYFATDAAGLVTRATRPYGTWISADWQRKNEQREREMRVSSDDNRLHMEPENDRDQAVCERLIAEKRVRGFGRDAETLLVIHIQITLPKRET